MRGGLRVPGQTPSQREPRPLPQAASARAWPPLPHTLPGLSLGTGPAALAGPGPARCLLHAPLPGPHRLRSLRALHCPPPPQHLTRPPAPTVPQCPQAVAGGEKRAALPRPQPDRTEGGEGVGPLPQLRLRSSDPTARSPARPHPCSAAPASRRPCGRRVGVHREPQPARPARAPCPHLPAAGQMLRRARAGSAEPVGARGRGRALLRSAAPPARARAPPPA